jgi:hypothetical protein
MVLPAAAVFFRNVQFVTKASPRPPEKYTAPPCSAAVFSLITLFVNVRVALTE